MPFVVTGIAPTGFKTATRASIASAILLAIEWDAAGVEDVLIARQGQNAICFKQFRDRAYESLSAPLYAAPVLSQLDAASLPINLATL